MKYLVLLFFLFPAMAAAGQDISFDPITPGDKRLGITLHEAGKNPNLSNITVEGYQVENAVLVQENDPDVPLKIRPEVIDATADSAIQILHYQPQQNLMIVESPSHLIWETGMIITDTSFQGLSQKVFQILELKRSFSSIQWQLKVTPASLLDVVSQCDISYSSKPRLSYSLPDTQWSVQVTGTETGSLKPVRTDIHISLKNLSLDITPLIQGRLRIRNNRIEICQFDVNGPYGVKGGFRLSIPRKGKYFYSTQIPFQILHTFPLGRGLNIQLFHSAQFKINSEVKTEHFQTHSSLSNNSEIHVSLYYENGQWRSRNPVLNLSTDLPLAQKQQSTPVSSGVVKCAVVPNLRMLWGGESGLSLSMETFTQVFQLSNYLGTINRIVKYGIAASAVPVSSPDSLMDKMKEIHLGILEKILMAPPVTPIQAVLKNKASDSLTFDWPYYPDVENYLIQMNTGETFQSIDTVSTPPYVATQLLPDVTYIFRIIPVNRMGVGIPAVVAGKTLKLNFPPSHPLPVFPIQDSELPDSSVLLKWRAEDPDSTDQLRYSLFLDTVSPPNACVFREKPDSTFSFSNPVPGADYFWRVDATDGRHIIKGPVWKFSTAKPSRASISSKSTSDVRVAIPTGKFRREDGRFVEISPFLIDKYEVSQIEFRRVMGYNPSFRQGDPLPVENVNWQEAVQYCREIGGRLPTEAEWEYAARAGTNSAYYWGAENAGDFAWYYANSDKKTHPVGEKKPNDWGLHDMNGNVFEWVADWHGKYKNIGLKDPRGSQTGNARVTRGGSWFSDLSNLKSSIRFKNRPAFSSYKLGFRCAFSIPKTQ